MDGFEIREGRSVEPAALARLYAAAFPDEDLWPLVQALLKDRQNCLSLSAFSGPDLAGHVIFTRCHIAGKVDKLALLGPLAVMPDRQRQGVGSALVMRGHKQLAEEAVSQVQVLGDPVYYGRFGFAPDELVRPPYPLPVEWRDAWQSLRLDGGESPIGGDLAVPKAWRQPNLWLP